MRGRIAAWLTMLALAGASFWLASVVLAADDDPLASGEVVRIDRLPDGSVDVYRSQADGREVVEHRDADGDTWFENNEVVGYDGEPVVCPDGEPLRVPLAEPAPEPNPTEVRRAQQGLPDGKKAVFNQYTGEFETVDAVTAAGTVGEVSYSEPLYYACGPDDEPVLKPLSEIDPRAAAEARVQMKRQIADSAGLTGLGTDPARHGG